jgi:hypothetical protein
MIAIVIRDEIIEDLETPNHLGFGDLESHQSLRGVQLATMASSNHSSGPLTVAGSVLSAR